MTRPEGGRSLRRGNRREIEGKGAGVSCQDVCGWVAMATRRRGAKGRHSKTLNESGRGKSEVTGERWAHTVSEKAGGRRE